MQRYFYAAVTVRSPLIIICCFAFLYHKGDTIRRKTARYEYELWLTASYHGHGEYLGNVVNVGGPLRSG